MILEDILVICVVILSLPMVLLVCIVIKALEPRERKKWNRVCGINTGWGC